MKALISFEITGWVYSEVSSSSIVSLGASVVDENEWRVPIIGSDA